MATIVYKPSDKVDDATGKTILLLRFSGGRDCRLQAKTQIYIDHKKWNYKTGDLIQPKKIKIAGDDNVDKMRYDEYLELRETMSELESLVLSKFHEADRLTVNKEWLVNVIDNFHHPEKYFKGATSHQSFYDVFDEYLSKKKLAVGRVRHYHVLRCALMRFEKYSNIEIDLEMLTADTLRDFETFLRNEYLITNERPGIFDDFPEKRIQKQRGQNTINVKFSMLRTLILWAIDENKTTNNPFKKFKMSESIYGTPYFITIDERNQIYDTDMSNNSQLAIQRDIFVFQCLIGCRVGDLLRMTKSNVINGAIEYIASKTKEGRPLTVRVPLNKTATEIIERYKGCGNKLLPFISEQKYNIYIKEAFTLAGITRVVTVINSTTREEEKRHINEIASSHLARRCFIGNLYSQVKDPNLIGKLSGHKEGSKAFARYRDIDEKMKIDLVNLLE